MQRNRTLLRAVTALLLCLGLAACTPGTPVSSEQIATSAAAPSDAASSSSTTDTASTPASRSSSASASAAAGGGAASKALQQEQTMTLEQKVGQLFFLAFRRDTDGTPLWTYNDATDQVLRGVQPGGVCLFSENVHTVNQLRTLVQKIQGACSTPPFLGIDQEGGSIQRIRHTDAIPATNVPTMWQVGQTGDLTLAEQIGGVLGSELTVFGINLDFAPVCDVFSNPKNTVIGHRAFSSDPQQVARFSTAVSAGIRKAGVIPVCKHFPGHGDTTGDTHVDYASVDKSLDELRQTELVPFQAQIQAGVEMVMVAHISLPQVNGDDTPASMSRKIVTGLLRQELGFDGVVITDALDMGAVAAHYSAGEAAVRAIQAGVDMLLMPADPQAAYDAVLAAVHSGEIPEAQLDASVSRILTLKQKYGIISGKRLTDISLLGSSAHQAVVNQVG